MTNLRDVVRFPPPEQIEGPPDSHYSIVSWFDLDYDRFYWCVNGCLYFVLTRVQVVESEYTAWGYIGLLERRLAPLAWLSMPVHDIPN